MMSPKLTPDNKPSSHNNTMSSFSKLLVITFAAVTCFLFILSSPFLNKILNFQNVLMFVATLLQAFLILYVVYWKNHKFDISLDAVIKYFTCGFLLTSSMAFCIAKITFIILDILFAAFATNFIGKDLAEAFTDEVDLLAIGMSYPTLYVIILFLRSFLVASAVEELCKYFGYLVVNHPDLTITETRLNLDSSLRLLEDGTEGTINDEDEDKDKEGQELIRDYSLNLRVEYMNSERSLNSIGNGITIAMVAVAVGFACFENLLYIFTLDGGIQDKFHLLIDRTILQTHPLAAAIQSINVCRQKLENHHTMKIGRIISPSILLHGTFNFLIVTVEFFSFLSVVKENENHLYNIKEDQNAQMIAFVLASSTIVIGILYYVNEAEKQIIRLNELQESMKISCHE